MTQDNLGQVVGLTRAAIAKIEAGSSVSMSVFIRLVDVLSLSDSEAMSLARELAGVRQPTTTPAPTRGAA